MTSYCTLYNYCNCLIIDSYTMTLENAYHSIFMFCYGCIISIKLFKINGRLINSFNEKMQQIIVCFTVYVIFIDSEESTRHMGPYAHVWSMHWYVWYLLLQSVCHEGSNYIVCGLSTVCHGSGSLCYYTERYGKAMVYDHRWHWNGSSVDRHLPRCRTLNSFNYCHSLFITKKKKKYLGVTVFSHNIHKN